VLRPLELDPGKIVVDLGSGAGYFALKMAPRVVPDGQVFAVDLRRESLIDGALIANTYHELTAPAPIVRALFASMRPRARLVVVDRSRRSGDESGAGTAKDHEIAAAIAERDINQQGFQTVMKDESFIDQPGEEDRWWLIVFRKP